MFFPFYCFWLLPCLWFLKSLSTWLVPIHHRSSPSKRAPGQEKGIGAPLLWAHKTIRLLCSLPSETWAVLKVQIMQHVPRRLEYPSGISGEMERESKQVLHTQCNPLSQTASSLEGEAYGASAPSLSHYHFDWWNVTVAMTFHEAISLFSFVPLGNFHRYLSSPWPW